jgi:hypothetical protein
MLLDLRQKLIMQVTVYTGLYTLEGELMKFMGKL